MATEQDTAVATQIIIEHVLRTYENQYRSESWRDLPEIPTNNEIMPREIDLPQTNEDSKWDSYQHDLPYSTTLPANIVNGPWPSKQAYVGTHYQLLREDSVASLRNAVKYFKANPNMMDDRETHVYTNIHFKGLLFADSGVAFRVEFSHERAGIQIRWDQSKRLQQGTIVALSPMSDMFRTVCKVAVVAARPIEGGLDQNPPVIDLFWGDNNDAVIDPVESYLMIEARSGYFEASRHMLVALQKLSTESFQLSRHLSDLDSDIGAPEWLEEHRLADLSSLIRPGSEIDSDTMKPVVVSEEQKQALWNIDIVDGFPEIPSTGMDSSQFAACERMVTKKVSIVQGPPGTGKTFTSVSALRVLIENLGPNSPPIIIAAQTNHALDQLMNHVLTFEPNVLRLGGRSAKENVEIQKRTLYTLRTTTNDFKDGWRGMKAAKLAIEARIEEIKIVLASLFNEETLSVETLLQQSIISQAQMDSLSASGWGNFGGTTSDGFRPHPITTWLVDQMIPVPGAPLINLGLPLEEEDFEFEQLQKIELDDDAESPLERETDALRGEYLRFNRHWTARCQTNIDERRVQKMITRASGDLYTIPIASRGAVYRFWEKQLSKTMLERLRVALREHKSTVDGMRVTKVIGCTTTGISKYRGLLAALKPRTLLIEEAAETLEGTVMAGMFESLEQLILVGDHQQLQAHATIQALEEAPYYLNMSMFERLVNNSLPYTMLNTQRRMISDVRKLLCIEPQPFYSKLYDHPSVLDRKVNRVPIPSLGGKDTYFFSHLWGESKDAEQSTYNLDEAEMVAGFFNHLYLNGIESSKITVLTFYNGQRKAILRKLKQNENLRGEYFNVFTVDSYQGEENDVILLSLVRSNKFMGIGFLENKNRLVVALSRARRGLFIFGNPITFVGEEIPVEGEEALRPSLWKPIIDHMAAQGRFDREGGLPIVCTKHDKTVRVEHPDQWNSLAGGCALKCVDVLPQCGHLCALACHPYDHSRVICKKACTRVLPCGHGCSKDCGDECLCEVPACVALVQRNLGRLHSQAYRQPNTSLPGRAAWDSTSSTESRYPPNKHDNMPPSQDCRVLKHAKPTLQLVHRDGNYPTTSRNYQTPVRRSDSKSWGSWNAKVADKKASEENARYNAANSVDAGHQIVFNEIHKPQRVDEDGKRVPDGSWTRRVVAGGEQPVPQSNRVLFAPTAIPSNPSAHPHPAFGTRNRDNSEALQIALEERDPPLPLGVRIRSDALPTPTSQKTVKPKSEVYNALAAQANGFISVPTSGVNSTSTTRAKSPTKTSPVKNVVARVVAWGKKSPTKDSAQPKVAFKSPQVHLVAPAIRHRQVPRSYSQGVTGVKSPDVQSNVSDSQRGPEHPQGNVTSHGSSRDPPSSPLPPPPAHLTVISRDFYDHRPDYWVAGVPIQEVILSKSFDANSQPALPRNVNAATSKHTSTIFNSAVPDLGPEHAVLKPEKIVDPSDLLGLGEPDTSPAAPSTPPGNSISDLAGLVIGNSPTADDFDQFEKQFQ